MGRLDLSDPPRDEDLQTSRRGGIVRSVYRDLAGGLTQEELVDIAEAAFVVANALETLAPRGGTVHPSTLQNLADILRVGLRGKAAGAT